MKDDEDDRCCTQEDALPDGDAEDLAKVPGVERHQAPDDVAEERRNRTHGEEKAHEECGQRIGGRGQWTHAKNYYQQGSCREESGEADAEEEGGHGEFLVCSLSFVVSTD